MYIAVTIKRYRAVKGVGEIKMSVGITAYYQVMQICQLLSGLSCPNRLSISASYLSLLRSLVLQSSGHWDLGQLLLVIH
ncbi:hypothetical protein NC653_027534 [Populus alba x Populus x berolinensis]|uniref:Uncharacterized protein n=1 Tax=Populus alba x Populus x berolinensis TaxID=444605 RepID=A0AAD6M5M0_9ROSI|nr:hypothetical protein NC653_027534 [Populus alba x Populus x berolinensis]